MIGELITGLVELVVGHVNGLSVAVTLLVGAHYAGYLKHVAGMARHVRVLAAVLAVLVLFGALDVGPVLALVPKAVGLVTGLLGGLVP